MKGRPVDPTRKRRQTGHRPQPGQAAKPRVVFAVPDAVEVVNQSPLEPPADLPEAGRPIWREIVAELEPRGLRGADLEAIRLMCMAAVRARQAAENIAQYGVLVKGARGPMINPLVRLERDSTMTYVRLAEQFGLTLASRTRLGLMTIAGASLLAELNADLELGE